MKLNEFVKNFENCKTSEELQTKWEEVTNDTKSRGNYIEVADYMFVSFVLDMEEKLNLWGGPNEDDDEDGSGSRYPLEQLKELMDCEVKIITV
jgi:hypothetical protein